MSSAVKRERVGVLVERDELERLSADDMATQREAEFLTDALRTQALQAAAQAPAQRGVCSNCGEVCAPLAVYCDQDCRDDDEKRRRLQARMGRAG